MFNVYKKQRIKEKHIEISDQHISFSTPSILFLSKYSDLEESFFESFNNPLWTNVTTECFSISIVNLMLAGKIKVVHFIDKTSILFNLIVFQSEGYNIQLIEDLDTEDILTKDILSVLKKVNPQESVSLVHIIKEVINKYIGTDKQNRPQKKFFYQYLKTFAEEHKWIKLKPNNKLFGTITNYDFEIELNKKNELEKSYHDFKIVKYRHRKSNVFFRKFIVDFEKSVEDDFIARYSND
jgi:hypothetical protein